MQKNTCFPELSGISARKAGTGFCVYAVDRVGCPVDRVHCAVDSPVDRAHFRLTEIPSVRNPESMQFSGLQALHARSTGWSPRSTGPTARSTQRSTGHSAAVLFGSLCCCAVLFGVCPCCFVVFLAWLDINLGHMG